MQVWTLYVTTCIRHPLKTTTICRRKNHSPIVSNSFFWDGSAGIADTSPVVAYRTSESSPTGIYHPFCTWKPTCDLTGIPICLHYFFTIPSWFLWTIFLQEILSRLETWLAELEVLLDRRIERRSGVLERRGVSEMSSLMCGLVLCEVDSCFWGVLKPLNLSFLRSDTVHGRNPKEPPGM